MEVQVSNLAGGVCRCDGIHTYIYVRGVRMLTDQACNATCAARGMIDGKAGYHAPDSI